MIARKTQDEIITTALKRPGVKKAYDDLEEEFVLLKEMLGARQRASKTQEEVASSMHTTTSVIGRLETGGGNRMHSPTVATLRRYAKALGCKLSIKFIQEKHHRS